MPEGDTIYRAAQTLGQALEGKTVTGFSSRGPASGIPARRLIGETIARVESRGKHLLIWFSPTDVALHTHMRMTGSWHLYRTGERWRKAAHYARAVIDVDGWTAVCFSAPVVEVMPRSEVERLPSLASLGPDALSDTTDLAEARRRLDEHQGWTIAEALLDQRVLAGVGNVYKCEVLFIHRVDPWTLVEDVTPDVRDGLLATAEQLLKRNVAPGTGVRITTTDDSASGPTYVYGRSRRPCPRCATPISRARQGEQGRPTYWCRRCQGPGPR
jgi:endonuclease VIII